MSEEGAPRPTCQAVTDAYGDHHIHVGCGWNSNRIHRHDSICDELLSAAQSAALARHKEVSSLIPGSRNCHVDIYLPNWRRGQPAALDVTIISALQQQTLAGAATTPGHALEVGEAERWLPTLTLAGQLESFLFPWSWNPSEAGVVRPSIRSGPLVATRAIAWASPLLRVPGTYSNTLPFHCGKEMPHYGSIASQPAQQQLTVSFRHTCEIVCFVLFRFAVLYLGCFVCFVHLFSFFSVYAKNM